MYKAAVIHIAAATEAGGNGGMCPCAEDQDEDRKFNVTKMS
jgi:hypothetical protein